MAIAACSSANFLLSHRVVFAQALLTLAVVCAGDTGLAAELSPAAVAAFDREARLVETRLDGERAGKAPFMWIDGLPADSSGRAVHG